VRAARAAAIICAMCLLLRAGWGLWIPHGERIAALEAQLRAQIAQIEGSLGEGASHRAASWAGAVGAFCAPAARPSPDRGAIPIADIEGDASARLDRAFGGMRSLFALHVRLAAARLAALAQSLPLGALALAAGLANGYAARRVRRSRLAPESAFAFGIAASAAWLAPAWLFAWTILPLPLAPDFAAWIGWSMAAVAAHFTLAFFGDRC